MTGRRQSYRYSPHIQYWDVCVAPRSAVAGQFFGDTLHRAAPTHWPQRVVQVLDEVRERAVGRALVRHVRRRTTIYFAPETAQAEPDPFTREDIGYELAMRDDLMFRANHVGTEAIIVIDPTVPPRVNEHGLIGSRDISLAHELAHAVGITHGFFPLFHDTNFARYYDADSREEGHALILENMYRSESRLDMRHTYTANGPGWSARSPAYDLRHALAQMAVLNYRREVPALANELENLPEEVAPYNPFREDRLQRSGSMPRHRARRHVLPRP